MQLSLNWVVLREKTLFSSNSNQSAQLYLRLSLTDNNKNYFTIKRISPNKVIRLLGLECRISEYQDNSPQDALRRCPAEDFVLRLCSRRTLSVIECVRHSDFEFNIINITFYVTRPYQQRINLNSYCCGNSICHSRGSGNPAFKLWTPAFAGVTS